MRRLPLLALFLFSCKPPEPVAAPTQATTIASTSPTTDTAAATQTSPEHAEVGKRAPDFTLVDLEGRSVSLHDFKGKTVVLEWFNPECPFVRLAHTKGSLKGMAARRTQQGVVWLAVNSGAEGKQGAGVEKNKEGKAKFELAHPILLDPTGKVGRAYGATNTPHMYVIDSELKLVYKGAIDNSPDAEGESPTDGKLVNHVDVALDAVTAHRAIALAETKAYGCSVKY
jgi:peroxiredoxin